MKTTDYAEISFETEILEKWSKFQCQGHTFTLTTPIYDVNPCAQYDGFYRKPVHEAWATDEALKDYHVLFCEDDAGNVDWNHPAIWEE